MMNELHRISRSDRCGATFRTGTPLLAIVLLCCALTPAAFAHPLAPALLELRQVTASHFEVRWKMSLLQPTGSDVDPELPPHCVPTSTPSRQTDAASATLLWSVDCGDRGIVGATLRVKGLEESRTDALVRVVLIDGRRIRAVLNAGNPTFEVPEGEQAMDVFRDYVLLGFEHIATGFDHLLFVFGLMLLMADRRGLFVTITSFTLGHSVTLSLAVLGFVSFPSRVIEVAIAFSIFMLALELTRGDERRSGLLGRRPWVMAGTFGLLHGFGFAGALSETGIPAGEIPLVLFSFNLGIEIGQLLFVACVLSILFTSRPWLRRAPDFLERLPAYGIGSLAAYWCFERAAGLW